jgi:predicted RND superfamily exporter protein
MMERLLRKTAGIIFSYHRLIAIAFTIITAISILVVSKMEIKTDIIDVLPSGSEEVVRFKDFLENYGALDRVTVVIEAEKGMIAEHLDLIESLAEMLKKSPMVEYVDYSPLTVRNDFFLKHFPLFLDNRGSAQLAGRLTQEGINRQMRLNRQTLYSPFSSPVETEMISKDSLKVSEIVSGSFRRSGKDNLDISMGYYFTKDQSSAIIFFKPKGKSRDMSFVKGFKKEIDSVISSALAENGNPAVRIELAGSHILSEELRQAIQHDVVSSSAISIVLIALLIWIAYRVTAATLAIIGFTLLSSLSMTLSSAYLLFGSLNIVTSVVVAVLIGQYVDYSIHLVNTYGDELRKGSGSRLAIEAALVRTGPSIIASALTTSLSFLSIVITRFEGLYELGIVCGMGVMLCFAATLLMMSSILVWVSAAGAGRVVADRGGPSGVEYLIRLVVGRPKQLLLSAGFLSVVLTSGISMTYFDTDPEHIGVKNSRSSETFKKIRQRIDQRAEPLFLIVKGKDTDTLTQEFDSAEKLVLRMEKDGLVGSHDSLGSFFPPPHIQKLKLEGLRTTFPDMTAMSGLGKTIAGSMDNNGILYDRAHISRYADGIVRAIDYRASGSTPMSLKELDSVSDPRMLHFYNKADRSIAAYLYPPGRDWDRKGVETIKLLAESGNRYVTGKSILFDEIKASIIMGSTLATLATLLLNLGIVYIFFKKVRYVLLAMLPVTLGFILVPGIMGYLDAPFNFINVGAIALVFGLGVDYGIYVMQAYLGQDKKDIAGALRVSGKNVMICSGTTLAGCGSLISSRFAGMDSVGLVLTIGTITCAAAALLVLPAILYIWEGK